MGISERGAARRERRIARGKRRQAKGEKRYSVEYDGALYCKAKGVGTRWYRGAIQVTVLD